jgi:putative radical SAM enzyme (TIGR03279 family)
LIPESPTYAGVIQSIEPDSLAAEMGLRPGDEVLAVNGHPVEDVIDVQFYAAEDVVEVTYRRAEVTHHASRPRQEGQALGLEFSHPTFDIDIRRCNNLCPFCFVLQTAPRMRRTLYIKDDDYRYSFLFGHFVTLTNLSPHDWERIETQHLSPLYISVHSTDLENRRACLANPKAPDILEQLRWLAQRGIEMHTQLVITPELNDGAWMEKSIRDLAKFYPSVRSVCVVPVGLTKHHKYGHRLNTREEAEHILDTLDRWQDKLLQRFSERFVYPTDEWFLVTGRPIPSKKYYADLALEENGLGQVRGFLDDWQGVKKEIKAQGARLKAQGPRAKARRKISNPSTSLRTSQQSSISNSQSLAPSPQPLTLFGRTATLVTGTLFESVLRQTSDEFNRLAGTKIDVVGVLNERLGHEITVAGLLMGADVIQQLKQRELGEFIVLPRVMFDHPQGISLDDISPFQISRDLGRPLFLADAMGDVLDAFTDANTLRFDPVAETIPLEVMKEGGWSVEKYL